MDLSRLRPLFVPIWRPLVALAAIGLIVWGFVAGYGERSQEAERERPVGAPQRLSIINGETVFTLDAMEQVAAGIQLVRIHNTLQRQPIRAYGTVVDPQPISDLHNSYANALAQLGMARAKLHQSQLAYVRAERLLAANAESMSNRDAAEATFRVDQATEAAAETQLQTVAATAQQNWGALLGSAILKGDATFQGIAARQSLLIQATLSPGQVLAQAPPDAIVSLENGTKLSAAFLSDAPKTDTHIQGVSFFYLASATPGLLPGMNVTVFLVSDRSISGAVVPSSSVVWWQGQAWVYVQSGATHFVRHAVAGDALTGEERHVVTGLPDGAAVVTRGAQILLSEEFRSQTPATEDQE